MKKECALKYLNAPSENPSTHCARLLKNVLRLVDCVTTALFLQNWDILFLKLNFQFSQRYRQTKHPDSCKKCTFKKKIVKKSNETSEGL